MEKKALECVHQKKFPSGVSVFKQLSWPQWVEICGATGDPSST